MVDDFLPKRGQQEPAGRPPVNPRPQLSRAQPFLRAGQLSRRENFSQEQAARLEGDSDQDTEGVQPDSQPDIDMHIDDSSAAKPPKKPLFGRFKAWWQARRLWQKIALIAGIVVLLAAIGTALYLFVLKSDPAPIKKATTTKKQTTAQTPAPVKYYSRLTGLEVSKDIYDRPVTGIMIENSPDARPQSGLNDAGVVFEAIAEGGITRFLTLFQDTAPDYIGPVRSVRPYYIQWAMGFNASIAHVGGSGEALQDMKDWGARDLDQFAGADYFWRITERYAPHNVYTSMAKLREYSDKKGYTSSNFTGLSHKITEVKPTTAPTARIIDLTISGFYYNAHYDYNAGTNSYDRKEGGSPHTDQKSGKQLSPKVVVALVMPYSLEEDNIHSVYNTIGSGKVYVFQDGAVTEGTWHKESRDKNFTFTDAAGKDIPLNPGQTWLTAVGEAGNVSYAP